MKRLLLAFFFMGCLRMPENGLHAQEVWSLEKCINHAWESNLSVKQARANARTSALAEQQAKTARLPNINATGNLGRQFGRTIDPTTNQFNNTAITFNSFGLNAGISLFNGGQIHQQVKQAQYDLLASEADAENTSQTLGLQVAQAYLMVLMTEEQLEAARRRVELSQRQLNNTQKLVDAGSVPLAEKLNIEAQIARDEQTAVTAVNSLEMAYLNLKQLLFLEPDFPLEIERPEFVVPADANPDAYTLKDVYAIAESQQPSVKAADYRLQSAKTGVKVAQSAYWPSVTAFANLNTNYSSAFRSFEVTDEFQITPPRPVVISGFDATLSEYSPLVITNDIPYFDQLDNNFGQSIGVGLSIPIYQNGRNRLNVERARLGIVTAELQQTQARQQLKNDIQTAVANAKAGKRQLDAAQRAFQSFQTAYENTEKRQSLGAANSLDLVTAKTNLDNAENDLLVAKYDYLFRLKIIDFYLGKPITLD